MIKQIGTWYNVHIKSLCLIGENIDFYSVFMLDIFSFTVFSDVSGGIKMNFKKSAAAVLAACTASGIMTFFPVHAADGAVPGDINLDGSVNIADLCFVKSVLIEETAASAAADVNADGHVNTADLVLLQKYFLGLEKNLPAVRLPQMPSDISPSQYMQQLRENLSTPEPSYASSKQPDVDYGTVKKISYFSTTANRQKSANVILPAGYSENEKYPVMYVNHGIFGDENSMLEAGMGIQTISANLAARGEAEKMIIVCGNMFSSSTMASPSGFDVNTTKGYDAYLDDLTKDLMPYIEKNFSVKTGRENTAITGFSMGGREALFIGISRPDIFGYIGGACPAPGITPTQDNFMIHPGCMQEAEFKTEEGANRPYVLMISGAAMDGVVGDHPQRYHNILTKNGCDHVWQEVPQGGHDGVTVRAHFYNFAKAAFRAAKG